MAQNARGTPLTPPRRRFDMRDFSRLAGWGLATLGALTIAAYAASSEIGENRLILAVASIRGVPPPERLARTPTDPATRQLVETIRELSADRSQLIARLESLERNVGDVTSSIARIPAIAAPPADTQAPVISAPEATLTSPPAAANATPDSPAPRAAAPISPDEPAPIKAEFGIDLGRANSVEGLRQLWNAMKSKHGGALEGLRPVVAVREIARGGGIELRLVAGPLANASAAARLCATLPGAACHPTVFDGQRLALR
jgi:hypothetical protein